MKWLPANSKLFAAIGIAAVLQCWALPSEKPATTYIESDTATYNYKTGTESYHGNVKILQNNTKLSGDTIMIYHLPDHSVDKIIAIGNPAQYIVLPTPTQQKTIYAQAERIETYPKLNKIFFIGDGKINDDKSTLTGPRLEYQMNTQNIISLPSNHQRTHVLIQPN